MTHTLLVSRDTASRVRRWKISGNLCSYLASFFGCNFRGSHSPSKRFDRADRRRAPIAAFSLSTRTMLGNGGNHSLHARNRANVQASPYGLGDFERMEQTKLAKGRGHKLPTRDSLSLAMPDQ